MSGRSTTGYWTGEDSIDYVTREFDVDLYDIADPHPNAEECLIAAESLIHLEWPHRAERRAVIAAAALARHARRMEQARLQAAAALARHARRMEQARLQAVRNAEWHRQWIDRGAAEKNRRAMLPEQRYNVGPVDPDVVALLTSLESAK